MHRQQRGITMIGWLFLLIPIALVGYAGVRLLPMYLNYFNIVRSMSQIAAESRGDDTAQTIRNTLEKRLDVEAVTFPDFKDFVVRRDGQAWILEIEYEDTAPYLSNVSLLVKFSKSVKIGKALE